MCILASGQSPWTDNKYAYRGISDSNTYYSRIGARLGSLSSRNPPPLFSVPWAQLSEFSSSCQISRLPFFLTGEMWEEECRICPLRLKEKKKKPHKQTTGQKKKKKRKRESKRRKRDSGYLSCSGKCHPGPAINHMGLWCVYLQLGASLPSTLLFSPLALRTHPPQHTQPFLLDQIYPALPPHSSLFHSLQRVCIGLSIHKMPDRCLGSYTEHCIWTESLIR